MNIKHHGISIGVERIGLESILTFKVSGKLTHHDYDEIMPVLDTELESMHEGHIKMLVDISDFEGWELRAAWDDFNLGMTFGFKLEKIAIYGEKDWQELAARVGSWFICGEMKSFGDYSLAMEWLVD